MPAKKEQPVVVQVIEKNEPVKTTVHPNIRKAADHVAKELGHAKPSPGRDKIAKALEGEPLRETVTTRHDKGDATFVPVLP